LVSLLDLPKKHRNRKAFAVRLPFEQHPLAFGLSTMRTLMLCVLHAARDFPTIFNAVFSL
jgi:hypothetical protein